MTQVTIEAVYDALRNVIDPEIGLDIVTLGLVYDVRVDTNAVDVTFTLTTPGCPMERAIRGGIHQALDQLEGVADVRTQVVWEPRWDPSRIQEGAL
jgi:metal-sulfur cluster biosynthetic enzyme